MIKSRIKKMLRSLGYRISRADRGMNRFQAVEDALHQLKSMSFRPDVVIDGGAHAGEFSLMCERILGPAEVHLIEPQAACMPILKRLEQERKYVIHPFALSQDGVGEVLLVRGNQGATTGAYVVGDGAGVDESHIERVQARSLDELFDDRLSAGRRILLKLDLQGHEMAALRGADRLLRKVEVLITEAQFLSLGSGVMPLATDQILRLREHGFSLFDIASLSGRGSDNRLIEGDLVFVRAGSPLLANS